jgi:heme exporter protein A
MGAPEKIRLKVTNLGCVRGGRTLFSDLNFEVPTGTALAIVGPNGAGKSSLLRLIAGLLRPVAGQILLEEGEPDAVLAEQVHYLGHQDAHKPALTVAENLTFWMRYLGGGGKIRDHLSAVGLAELADLPAGVLSAGQARRLSLARLLVAARPIWLLDEPTTALDFGGQEMLGTLMRNHLAGGGMILAATHGLLPTEGIAELRMGQH